MARRYARDTRGRFSSSGTKAAGVKAGGAVTKAPKAASKKAATSKPKAEATGKASKKKGAQAANKVSPSPRVGGKKFMSMYKNRDDALSDLKHFNKQQKKADAEIKGLKGELSALKAKRAGKGGGESKAVAGARKKAEASRKAVTALEAKAKSASSKLEASLKAQEKRLGVKPAAGATHKQRVAALEKALKGGGRKRRESAIGGPIPPPPPRWKGG